MAEPMASQFHLKQRSDLHMARKVWHIITVFLMFLTYRLAPEMVSKTILLLSFCIFVPLDILRLRSNSLNDLILHFFRPVARMNEVQKLAGTTYLLTGVTVVTFLLPRPIVLLTLLFLAFADPIASYVGIRYGKDKIFGQKTMQGFAAAFLVCFLCSFIFLYSSTIPHDRLIVFSVLAGLLGGLAELIPIGQLDDNLTLPILSGFGLYVLFYFFGFFDYVL